MCRHIKTLVNLEPPATENEIREATQQFVRKISGLTTPSSANARAFNRAVDEITKASSRLLGSIVTTSIPKRRKVLGTEVKATSGLRGFVKK
jgi:hypothetical protein